MNKSRGFFAVIMLVLVLAMGLGIMYMVNETRQNINDAVNQAVSPVNDFSTAAARLFNPTPTILPDPITIINKVQSLARLETIQYSLEKVITAEIGQGAFGFLFGDKILFIAHGIVIAGVDLGKLQLEDMEVVGNVLEIALPEAEVFVATLDNDKSYVYDREVGILNKGEVNLETNARQAAEKAILEAALEDGILEQAQVNAENFLFRLLRDLGFEDIVFVEPRD